MIGKILRMGWKVNSQEHPNVRRRGDRGERFEKETE
jgi:hypothetical protein